MPELGSQTETNIFRIFLRGFETIADSQQKRVRDFIDQRLALGYSREEIVRQLEIELESSSGIFKELIGAIEKQIDMGLNTVYQVSSNEPLAGVAKLFQWTLDPIAEHCDSCLYQAKLPPRSFDIIPYPSTQPTVGESNCQTYCKCTLEPVNA